MSRHFRECSCGSGLHKYLEPDAGNIFVCTDCAADMIEAHNAEEMRALTRNTSSHKCSVLVPR